MIQKPMLAVTMKDMEDIVFPVYATPKLDGIRCLIVKGQAVTRNFKPFPNNHIRERANELPSGLDGEMMVKGKKFNELSSLLMSGDGEPKATYVVFDYLVDTSETYLDRIKRLKALNLPKWVKVLKPKKISNKAKLEAYEKKCLSKGYEGVIFRSADSPYKFGRSTMREGYLVKLKQFSDSEAEVIELVEQVSNTNKKTTNVFGRTERSGEKAGMIPKGTLGAIKVKDLKTGIEFNVGSGFDDAIRREIWDNKHKYIGKIVKYKHQKSGAKDAPRFPTFIGFRDMRDMGE